MAESAPAGDGVVHAFGIGAAAVRRLRIGLAVAGVLFAALVVWLAREEGFGALYVSTLTAVAAMCRALASATVVEERLVIFGRGGIQLEAVDMLGRTTEEYIERRRFRAIVMNEYVTPLRVRNVLTLIFCDGEVRPLFQVSPAARRPLYEPLPC
mmetsp:Transcript_3139/g.8952  ORF Transcript_3139/g.8952 Transcript_3139/m.8952 type:complete len:154 (+) Transcript_3139:243-704(+)